MLDDNKDSEKARRHALYEKHKERIKQKSRRYQATHKEQIKQRQQEYYKKHQTEIKQARASYYHSHKEMCNQRNRQYIVTHKEQINQNRRELKARLKQKVLDKLGNKCVRCGFSDLRALQIDHVNGHGTKERIKLWNMVSLYRKVLADTSGSYQLLCANCNWIKRAEKGEYR